MLNKILIVENEPDYYFNFRDILRDSGFLVDDFCATYQDAIEMIENNHPDIAILDIDLDSDESGIDIGNYLYQNTDIPFIFMTAIDDREVFHEALHTHHKSFLVKSDLSTDKEKVVRTIMTVLNNSKANEGKKEDRTIGATGLKGYSNKMKNSTKTDDSVYKRFIAFENIAYFSTERVYNEKFEQLTGVEKGQELKRGYLWFQTDIDDQVFIMSTNFKNIKPLLPDYFVQISQQYIVNILPKFLKKSRTENSIFVYDQELKITRGFVKETRDALSNKYLEG